MKERYALLDGLRGFTLLSMIAYHGMFDLTQLYDVPVVWFWHLPGYIWQQSICWAFILLSGFCWNLGRHPLKRGLIISGCGLLISLITTLFMPSEKILFGILTFTGAAMLLLIPLSKVFDKIPAWAGLASSVLLFILTRNVNRGDFGFASLDMGDVPKVLYEGLPMTFLGFPDPDFFSSDYFSVFPWIFLYLVGFFLYRVIVKIPKSKEILTWKIPVPLLETAGRNSLLIYLLHQPVLMSFFTVLDRMKIL